MVAFFLPEHEANSLAVPEGEPADNLHVTSIYLGDISEIKDDREVVEPLVSTLARRTTPFSGVLDRVSHFGPSEDGLTAVVLEADSGLLHRFRTRLKSALQAAGVTWDEKFPTYRPHVTLGYWPEDEIPDRFSKPGPLDTPIPVTFSEVSMKWDGERIDTPFGAAVASVQPLEFDWRNQPRDSKGRWAETGSWGRPGKGTPRIEFIVKGANRYRRQRGLPDLGSSVNVMGDEATSKEVAAAYTALPNDDKKAHTPYGVFAKEIEDQYDFVTKSVSQGGLGIKVEVIDTDPYSSHREMVEDVLRHRRIRVMATATTGPHPLLTDDQNDKFRAIHDLFGHAGTGRPFDRNGEEAAWFEHASMFSEEARGPMTTETRGQNGVLINTGSFPDQKVGLLPKKFYDDEALRKVRRSSSQRIVRLAAEDEAYNPIAVLQASAIELGTKVHVFSVQPLEFHGVNTHNEKAHGKRGRGGDVDLPDADNVPKIVSKKQYRGLKAPTKGNQAEAIQLVVDKAKAKFAEYYTNEEGDLLIPEFENLSEKQQAKYEGTLKETLGLTDEDIEQMKRNLDEAADRSTDAQGDGYRDENQWGVGVAKRTGVDPGVVFGITSLLSGQRKWSGNQSANKEVTERLLDRLVKDEPIEITEAMAEDYNRYYNDPSRKGHTRAGYTELAPGAYRPSELTSHQLASLNPFKINNQTGSPPVHAAIMLARGEITLNQAITGPKQRSFVTNLTFPERPRVSTNDVWHYRVIAGNIKFLLRDNSKNPDGSLVNPDPDNPKVGAKTRMTLKEFESLVTGVDKKTGKPVRGNSPQTLFQTGLASKKEKLDGLGYYPYITKITNEAAERFSKKKGKTIVSSDFQARVWKVGGGDVTSGGTE